MTTNTQNALDVLNTHFLFKHLTTAQKEILAELITDENTKVILPASYETYITISNNKHQLTINGISQAYNWNRLETIDNIEPKTYDENTSNYPFEVLKTQQEVHEDTWYDREAKLVINQIGDFDEAFQKNKNKKVTLSNEILTLSYEFYLDHELIMIRNYNADLKYFLKHSTNYAPIDVYNFFDQEVLAFNKTNYDILKLFKSEQYFTRITAYKEFDRYFKYNLYFNQNYYAPKTDFECEVFLSTVYFKTVCIPKLKALIQPNLDILAKNGFEFVWTLEEEWTKETLEPKSNDSDGVFVRYKTFWWSIINKKTKINLCWGYGFDFDFHGLLYEYWQAHNFKDTMKKLDQIIIDTANKINHHLQPNEIVYYYKILKALNYSNNNIAFNHLQNSNKSYISDLQFDYGHLKNKHDRKQFVQLDNYVVVWKYDNDTLFFQRFKVSELALLWIKYKDFDKIPLKHHLTNVNTFTQMVYQINAFAVEFTFRIALKDDDNANPWENNALRVLPDIRKYTKYSKYARLSADTYTKILTFNFTLPLEEDINIDEIMHDIYNEFKDKIILKDSVSKKLK